MATYEKKTDDGTHIKVEGAGPEIPSVKGAPSNHQINSGIKETHHHLEKQKPHLNDHGKRLVTDAQGVLDTTAVLVKKKNKEERFQKLYTFSRGAAAGGPSEGLASASRNLMQQASGMGGKISHGATDLPSYIRETVYNLATSGEFRELVVEFLTLFQSVIAQTNGDIESAKTDIATKNNPTPDRKALKHKARRLASTEDEQLEAIRERLNIFLRHVNQQKEYRDLVNNFLKYSEQIFDTLYEAKEAHATTKEAEDLNKLLSEAWEILGDFAGRELVMKFRRNLKTFAKEARRDDKLRAWGKESKKTLHNLMENPDKVDNKEINLMIKEGRALSLKYRVELNHIGNEAQKILYRIRTDPTLKEFQRKLKTLGRNMVTNSAGRPDLFVIEESMASIKDLLVEMFRDLLVDIPIKKVEVHNDDIDMVLSEITIAGTGMVPGSAHVKMASYTDLYFEKSPDAETHFRIGLRVHEIKPVFKDVHFAYEKKTFPKISDKGVTDVIFEGDGLSANATISFTVKSGAITKARVRRSNLTLDTLRFDIDKEKTKHNILDSMFSGMVAGRLRTRLQTSMEAAMTDRLNQFVAQLNKWFATKPFETLRTRTNESMIGAQEKRRVTADKKADAKSEAVKRAETAKLEKEHKKLKEEKKLKEAEHHNATTVRYEDLSKNYPQQPHNVPAKEYFPETHATHTTHVAHAHKGEHVVLASGESSTTSQVQADHPANVSSSTGVHDTGVHNFGTIDINTHPGYNTAGAHPVDVRPGVHTDPLHTPAKTHPVGQQGYVPHQ